VALRVENVSLAAHQILVQATTAARADLWTSTSHVGENTQERAGEKGEKRRGQKTRSV
jgi:hypothetical protein